MVKKVLAVVVEVIWSCSSHRWTKEENEVEEEEEKVEEEEKQDNKANGRMTE